MPPTQATQTTQASKATSPLVSPAGGEILSVAIEIANQTQLRKLNQSHPLASIIQELCLDFKLPYQDGQYALQLNLAGTTTNMYIHEQNRRQVKNGDMLKLVYSPSEMAKILINKILVFKEQAGHEDLGSAWGEEAIWTLSKLQDLSSDVTFAKEFSDQDGLQLIVFELLSEPKMTTTHLINCCLSTLDQLMAHNFVHALTTGVLNRVVSLVDKNSHIGDSESRASALSILARFVSSGGYEFVSKALPVHQIIPHLCREGERTVQKNALALLVAFGQMAAATGNNGKSVRSGRDVISRQVKEAIDKSILKDKNIDDEMAKELLNYQTLVLSGKEKKLNAMVDPGDPDLVNIMEASLVEQAQNRSPTLAGSRVSMGSLDEHMMIAAVTTGQRINNASSYHETTPPPPTPTKTRLSSGATLEPTPTPTPTPAYPSVSRLAVDCIIYFHAAYPKPFTRVFLGETTAAWQPFEQTCQRLVEIVAAVLCVQKQSKKKKSRKGYIHKYQPLVFKEPAFLEEVFSRMFLQLGRTRRDMRARTGPDQEKVLTVLQRQLAEALDRQPNTLKELTQHLRGLGYAEIAELWAQEAKDKENWRLAHSPPILHLRQARKEALLALVKEQRINVLLKGTIFPKTSFGNQKAKRRNTFVVLSSNQKSFHYHDCDEDDRSVPGTSGKIAIGEIAAVLLSQRWPPSKTVHKPELVFSLVLEASVELGAGPPRIDFMAPDQDTFDQWTDGINAILGKEMTSKSLTADIEKLLDMEVRLLLLDIDSKLIPNEPPAVPPPPTNFDFACP